MLFDQAEFDGTGLKVQVWCRNGGVCNNAAPCEDIPCGYKTKAENVLQGIKKCGTYQTTVPSGSWEGAIHWDLKVKPKKKK